MNKKRVFAKDEEMEKKMTTDNALELERSMWEAAKNRDADNILR